MKATKMLREDHDRVRMLFNEWLNADGPGRKEQLVETICQELEIHTKLEEELFYPLVREHMSAQGEQWIDEAIREHDEVENLCNQLKQMHFDSGNWDGMFSDLRQKVEHHAGEEEREMFPACESEMGSSLLDAVGEQMAARKEQLRPVGARGGR